MIVPGLRLARTASGLAAVRTITDGFGNRVRVLRQGGVFQSATYLDQRRYEPVFAYQRAFDRMFDEGVSVGAVAVGPSAADAAASHPVRDVLMIGGGGYAWPKHAIATRQDVRLDVVEIDPVITQLARRYFFLSRLIDEFDAEGSGRLGLICDDGRDYLERCDRRYDAAVNDAFSGGEPARGLLSLEAALAVRGCLVENGLYLLNVVSRDGGTDLRVLRDVAATLSRVFARVSIVPCSDQAFDAEDNYLVIATDSGHVFDGAIPYDVDFIGDVIHDDVG